MADSGVDVKNVSKIFEDKTRKSVVAVDDVSFSVSKGELVTLLGPSGCGKTTILRMIGGFELPSKGDIFIDGKSVGMLPPNRRNTSMVFQSYALFPHMSVYNNIAYGPRLKKHPRGETDRKVRELMAAVGLGDMGDRSPAQLSGGQQQRVALARALINEPSVLLFDEPLSNLDVKLRVQMREEIRRIQRKVGITSIYVTHDQEEAVCISDRIILMNEGIIEQIGTPREIYEKPDNRFVAGFFGKVNFLPAQIIGVSGSEVTADILGRRFTVNQPGFVEKPGCRAEAVLRPEAVTLVSGAGSGIPAVVAREIYMGNDVEYTVRAGELDILISVRNPKVAGLIPEGADVRLSFDPASLHLITY
ncbi:MAG: ABC transporter ATP-binding protein [bacterium]